MDSCADVEKTGWAITSATVGAAARSICDPFGIKVDLPDGDVSLDTTHPCPVQPGMTSWQLLEELARAAQMLIWDDAAGRLVLSKAGTKRAATALVEGENIELAQARISMDQRYSQSWVPSQVPVAGTDGHVGYFSKDVRDDGVPRRRLLMMVMDMPGPDGKWAKQRAEWEKARRYGRSRQIHITTTGWRSGDGALWAPNTIIRVKSPTLKFDEDLLAYRVSWVRGPEGTQTELQLMPRGGVLPEPFIPNLPIPLDPVSAFAP